MWDWKSGKTWAGIGLGAIAGGLGGAGFATMGPALAGTGFFSHFGTSGAVAAFGLTGTAMGGAAGYATGFGSGALASNGNWAYARQAGGFYSGIGAAIGSVAGSLYGLTSHAQQYLKKAPVLPPSSNKDYFSNYYSEQEIYNSTLVTSDGPGFSVGISQDVNITLGGIGGTFELGDYFNMPGNYHSYGNTMGFEVSYGINLNLLYQMPNYNSSDFFGLSSEFDFNIPGSLLSISLSSNNTKNVFRPGNDFLNSYLLLKIGIGIGVGGSVTPNSTTRKNYFFYGDPNPRRFYWNPTWR